MNTLSTAEEQLMQFLWKQKKAVMKELLQAYPEPKPANTTVATLLKRMGEKGYVGYTQKGRSREYFPKVKKKDYFSNHVQGLIQRFFNNSATQFASFFTEETALTQEELKALRSLIDEKIENINS